MRLLAPAPNEIRTGRLILRRWREEDLDAFADLQSDPLVRRFFLRRLPREEAVQAGRRHAEGFDRNGFDVSRFKNCLESGDRRVRVPVGLADQADKGIREWPRQLRKVNRL